VGTGFHPELTGRENTFLSGAILGMGKAEIERKFDEIVAFAELEKFIDTPVKHYSSGMYVRLAFAVAAHLEPEILLVDEVLAVATSTSRKSAWAKWATWPAPAARSSWCPISSIRFAACANAWCGSMMARFARRADPRGGFGLRIGYGPRQPKRYPTKPPPRFQGPLSWLGNRRT